MTAGREPSLTLTAPHASLDASLASLLRHSAHAMALVDGEGRVLFANARAEPLLNSATADLLGRRFTEFLVEPDHRRFEKRLLAAQEALDGVEDLDVHLDRPEDGLVAISFLPTPAGVLLQVRDLTREKAERDRATQQRKMIDLGMLISGVAHELRTPVTYVTNSLVLARRKLEEVQREHPGLDLRETLDLYDRSYDGLQRVERLIRDLRPLTKNKPHRTDRLDLAELAMDAVRTFRTARTNAARVTLDLQSTHAIPVDREDMLNVLLNLITNAAEATGPTGTVHIETRNADVPPTIRVIDHGPGVAPSTAARLFEPFHTTKPDGTGLGLFLSRRTVEAHGGTLTYEPTPGGGATFVLRLPTT